MKHFYTLIPYYIFMYYYGVLVIMWQGEIITESPCSFYKTLATLTAYVEVNNF